MNYKSALISLIIGFVVAGSWYRQRAVWQSTLGAAQLQSEAVAVEIAPPEAPTVAKNNTDEPVVTLPSPEPVKAGKVVRLLPFSSQAPAGVWDAWHEEACEEASMVLWWRYWLEDNRTTIPVDEMEQYMQDVAKWEREHLGTDVSTTIGQVEKTLIEYYQIPAEQLVIKEIKSEDDLKLAVNEGVIIAPFAGQLLANPHFKNGGPRYHMALITGFDGTDFITHDVGTKHGSNYRYSGNVLFNALHDFIPENEGNITEGSKIVLIAKRLP